jgi:hypothetical protein
MKERKPQFLKMNAGREENPPHREVACPGYRTCLAEAAFKNFCLDCSLCAGVPIPDCAASAGKALRVPVIRSYSRFQALRGCPPQTLTTT